MDYQKIHDAFILSRLNREHDSSKVYHSHHIVPLHEDPNSTETVDLTLREHSFVHRLRYHITKTPGNYIAWKALSGLVGKDDVMLMISSEYGKLGGRTTKETEVGIFDPNWDRSKETARRWKDGVINHSCFEHLRNNGHYARAGATSVMLKSGIHADDYDRSEANRQMWLNLSNDEYLKRVEMLKQASKLGTAKSVALGTNFSSMDSDSHKAIAVKGNKAMKEKYKNHKRYNNGIKNIFSLEHPGDGWVEGWKNKKNLKGLYNE